jgi:hypothetical protein
VLLKRLQTATDVAGMRGLSEKIERVVFHKPFDKAKSALHLLASVVFRKWVDDVQFFRKPPERRLQAESPPHNLPSYFATS